MTAYWTNKRVLVTGGAGFAGSHLCELLRDAGATVRVLDNFSRGSTHIDGVEYIYGDAGNEGNCRDVLKYTDVVFNLAAWVAGVIYNQSHHFEMYTNNMRLLTMPLKIALDYGIERFLQVSSVCIYAPEHNHPCVEENGLKGEPTGANVGYSLAKRAGERLAVWAHQEHDLHTVIVRPSNLFGPRDYFDDRAHVIPALIRKCLENDVVHANGTGHEQREFLYVDDVARGMIAAIEHGDAGEVYNLGTNGNTCFSIRDLLTMIQEWLGTSKLVWFSSQHDPGDDVRWSDASKADCMLEWQHEVGLEEGLRRTVEWYQRHSTRGEL